MSSIKHKSNILSRKHNISIASMVMLMFVFLSACGGKKEQTKTQEINRDSLPQLVTSDINTLISDSGKIQYHMEAGMWRIYDKTKPPYWVFEDSVCLEKYDSLMHVEATVRCDTAYYYNTKEKWKLIGNVEITNVKGEKFLSKILYWDKYQNKVYSDSSIVIKQSDKTIFGKGFESDQNMVNWTIRQVEGVMYVDNTIVNNDTTKTNK